LGRSGQGDLQNSRGRTRTCDPFNAKMALLGTILLLEIWPMVTLIRWRILIHRGATVDTQPAQAFACIREIQAVLVVLMVFAATALARGVFL